MCFKSHFMGISTSEPLIALPETSRVTCAMGQSKPQSAESHRLKNETVVREVLRTTDPRES